MLTRPDAGLSATSGGPFDADAVGALAGTAFQHPGWLAALHDLNASRGATDVSLNLRDHGRPIAHVPMTLRTLSGVRLLEGMDGGVCDYVAPAIDPTIDPALDPALGGEPTSTMMERLRAALPRHDILRIRNIRPEHVAFWEGLAGARAKPAGYSAHAVALAGSFAEWRKIIDRSVASQTARKWKRWTKAGAVFEEVRGARAETAIHELARLREGRFEGDPIQTPEVRAFYARVARESEHARTFLLREGDAIAGVLFGITHETTFHYLLIGCDYERFGRHSPGQQMYERVIETWMGKGGETFDFTIGDEPFKRQYGTTPTPISEIAVARTVRGRLAKLVLERRGRA